MNEGTSRRTLSMANSGASSSTATPEPVVFTAADILGAELSVPYEAGML